MRLRKSEEIMRHWNDTSFQAILSLRSAQRSAQRSSPLRSMSEIMKNNAVLCVICGVSLVLGCGGNEQPKQDEPIVLLDMSEDDMNRSDDSIMEPDQDTPDASSPDEGGLDLAEDVPPPACDTSELPTQLTLKMGERHRITLDGAAAALTLTPNLLGKLVEVRRGAVSR